MPQALRTDAALLEAKTEERYIGGSSSRDFGGSAMAPGTGKSRSALWHYRSSYQLLALVALVSWLLRPETGLAMPPQYEKGGTGWDRKTIASTSNWGNRRGQALGEAARPANLSQLSLGVTRQALESPASAGGGSGVSSNGRGYASFKLTIPVARLPGRGLDLALDLHFDSHVWHRAGRTMVFDVGADWPAPGFQLGFGSIIQFPNGLPCPHCKLISRLIEPDGTSRPTVLDFEGKNAINNKDERTYRTTDGSLIDYTVQFDGSQVLFAVAKYPNGMEIHYRAKSVIDEGIIFPTRIIDVNGNVIVIDYRSNRAPQIETIYDTVGRAVRFHYDTKERLTAITAPGYGDRDRRTLARLHYAEIDLNLENAFAAPLQAVAHTCKSPAVGERRKPCPVQVIDAVVYPGTRTGYWFGDAYSSYGMPTKVSERRNMDLVASSLNEQGSISLGLMTRERSYDDYPLVPSGLADAPAYTTMTEKWTGMDAPPPVTRFQTDPIKRTSTITRPDGTRIVQTAYSRPSQFDDGLPALEEVFDTNQQRLRSTTKVWQQGDANGYYSPRIKQIVRTDEADQKTATEYDYGPWHNQVETTRELDYGGGKILRGTRISYETDWHYRSRHIFNLPKVVEVFAGSPGVAAIESKTEFSYDEVALLPARATRGRDERYTRGLDYDPETRRRGLITKVRRYADAANPSTSVVQDEDHLYDETGNLIYIYGSACCQQIHFVFEPATQYAWPSRIARGSGDPNSPVRLEESFRYDFGTGLTIATTDFDGRITEMRHFPDSLRLASTSFPRTAQAPSLPNILYEYDDVAMTIGWGAVAKPPGAAPIVAAEASTTYNGLGLPRETRVRANDGGWDVVELRYDALGRLERRSFPFRGGLGQHWIVQTYDALDRLTSRAEPGDGLSNASSRLFYNETNRPTGATAGFGQTIRLVDPIGRETWMLSDALGRVQELVQPDPAGEGSVFAGMPLLTRYSYDAQYLQVNQGSQEQRFRYDSLGRLTHQAMPGRDAVFDGPDGKKYSDVFVYDQFSNLVSRRDARNSGENYIYDDDPLRRLKRIELAGGAGVVLNRPGSPSAAAQNVSYEYMTSGNVRRIHKITTPGVVEEIYNYDREGRLEVLSRIPANRPNFPLDIRYGYDEFGRLTVKRYPAQFGVALGKSVTYEYGRDSRPQTVKVNGEPIAANIVYNASGQISGMSLGPNGPRPVQETNDYYANGRMLSQTIKRGGNQLFWAHYDYSAAGQLFLQLENNDANIRRYTYDALGRLKTVAGGPHAAPSHIRGYPSHIPGYSYDDLGRLIPVVVGSHASAEWNQTYSYDQYGNRIGTHAAGVISGGAQAPADGITQLAVSPSTGRIESPGFGYDRAGRITRAQRLDGVWQLFDYDRRGRLVSVTDTGAPCGYPICFPDDSSTEIYRYGADGHRVVTENAKIVGVGASQTSILLNSRVYHVWDDQSVIADYTETQGSAWAPRLTRSYVYLGSRLLATFEPGPTGEMVRYYHPDRLHTRLITSPAEDATISQSVLPFGTPLDRGPPGTTNRYFTNYERSPVTGLDYAINRYYAPALGRFTQPDPRSGVQDSNGYTYAHNDPINLTDPLGLRECDGQRCVEVSNGVRTIYDQATGRIINEENLETGEITVYAPPRDRPETETETTVVRPPPSMRERVEPAERTAEGRREGGRPAGRTAPGRAKAKRSANVARQYAIELGSYEVERYLWQQSCLAAFSQKYEERRQQAIDPIRKEIATQAAVITGLATLADPFLSETGIPRIVKALAVAYGAAGYLLASDIVSFTMFQSNFSIVVNPPCR